MPFAPTVMKKIKLIVTILSILISINAFAKEPLQFSLLSLQKQGSWVKARFEVANTSGATLGKVNCCTIHLENKKGYSISTLSREELTGLISNKMKTAATIGTIVGVGLGIGGLASDNSDLLWASLGLELASMTAGALGEAAMDKQYKEIYYENIQALESLPRDLKTVVTVYFPPARKWQGSKTPKNIHLSYDYRGKTHETAFPVSQFTSGKTAKNSNK